MLTIDDQVLRHIITSDSPGKEAQFQDLQVDLTKYALRPAILAEQLR